MSVRSAYWSAEKFANELITELGPDFHSQVGRLILSTAQVRELVWAHSRWSDAELIEIASIGDGVKKLRERTSKLYAMAPLNHVRRATLIDDQLGNKAAKARLKKPIEFLELLRPSLAQFGLIEPGLMIASPATSSWVPQGEMQFVESSEAPSRAYLKLWELFTMEGFKPAKNETCLDLGASPGGWTWVLAKLGAKVTSIDKADLAPEVARMPGVQLLKKDAFRLKPSDIGPLDWLFSDVICEPQRLLTLVHEWRESGLCKNFVCTIKFKGETDFKVLSDFLKIEGSHARHLFHNKHEVTWWLLDRNKEKPASLPQ